MPATEEEFKRSHDAGLIDDTYRILDGPGRLATTHADNQDAGGFAPNDVDFPSQASPLINPFAQLSIPTRVRSVFGRPSFQAADQYDDPYYDRE